MSYLRSYEALGLVASLNPTASGGAEMRLAGSAERPGAEEATEASSVQTGKAKAARTGGIRKGYGRIIRDEAGNVVDVQLGEDEGEGEGEEAEAGMEGVPDATEDESLGRWVGVGTRPSTEGSARVVQGPIMLTPVSREIAGDGSSPALEDMSKERGGRARRFASAGELATLRRLVGRYGEDVEGMARDRKLNAGQRTAGELSWAINKAGGVGALSGVE
ncbi:uncharacterized protein FIBRA_08399 [Fibroporia radiculosa]|uniref:Uncharacterized protein n=1 Tax=Fibroporia radiculosa TaxID=599839 RepID=J4GWR0_9APHY|nr:uncharacterized protein FIBRA_08399 [Fibroporia radiculosa]CCM06160.1 predicted protein [Fibroporia radiculosa]